jgi:hypothetical protein
VRTESRVGVAVLVTVLLGVAPQGALAGSPTLFQSATTGTVAPTAPVAPAAAQGGAPRQSRGVRRSTPQPGAASPVAAPPQAQGKPLVPAAESLLSNFNGVSSRDSAVTNFGQEFEPPDQGLCVGDGFVVEMVNSAYTVYDTKGKALAGPFNVNGPFNEGLTEFTSDPRCYFDAATHTWFATILAINPAETESFVDVAVNNTGDPTKVWKTYKINTTDVGGASGPKHPGCPCLGDQPTLGIDKSNLYVTTNEFNLTGPEVEKGAQVYAFAKKDLVALNPAHFVHFDKLSLGGTLAKSVQPALTTGKLGAEYFLSSIDPSQTFDQRIGVWALTEGAVVAKGGIPKLSALVLQSEAFGVPPNGEQKGSESLINAGDDRMQQTQFIAGSVWGELDTALTIPGDSAQRAAAAWFEVRPSLSGGSLAAAHIRRQGYVALAGNNLLYPALQVTPAGAAAVVVSLTGATHFPSAAFATLAPGASSFGPVSIAAAGTTHYAPEAERWGDYSFAVLDPEGSSVWLATEYMPPKASQTPDGRRDWGTRVLQVTP